MSILFWVLMGTCYVAALWITYILGAIKGMRVTLEKITKELEEKE